MPKKAPRGVGVDERRDLRLGEITRLGDARNLRLGVSGRDVGIKAGARSRHRVGGDGSDEAVGLAQGLDVALDAVDQLGRGRTKVRA